MTRSQIARATSEALRERLQELDEQIASIDYTNDDETDRAWTMAHEQDGIDLELYRRVCTDERVRTMLGERIAED